MGFRSSVKGMVGALLAVGLVACGGAVENVGSRDAGTDTSATPDGSAATPDSAPTSDTGPDAAPGSDAADSGLGDTADDAAIPCPPKNLVRPGDEFVSCCNGRPCRGECSADGTCDCFGIDGGCWEGTVCCRREYACTGVITCR